MCVYSVPPPFFQFLMKNNYICIMKFSFVNIKNKMLLFQFLGWFVIIALSLIWGTGSNTSKLDVFGLVTLGMNLVVLMFIYLLNYFVFIPRFLFRKKRWLFVLANASFLAVLLCTSYYSRDIDFFTQFMPRGGRRRAAPSLMFLVRDLINYILMVGLVTAFRLAEKLQKSEEALKEAENARVKAELMNLKSQINPHFLLNTLNNIYALTAIDTDKAQKTIKELSDLLRYVLYENRGDKVSVVGEVKFLKTYIELMSIRLPRKVRVASEFKVSENSATMIAPLIFISLVENAFKHSVSASGEGFIELCFEDREKSGEVSLEIRNSNNAKEMEDKSGHGIGLEQVTRRLELQYKGLYSWEVEKNDEVYCSKIVLKSR